MIHDRKAELIACCEGIIRNADKIADNLVMDVDLDIRIRLNANEAPNVEITKTFLPKEVVEAWHG